MTKLTWWIATIVAGAGTAASVSAVAHDATAPVEVRVAFAPTAFRGSDGAMHLAYELQITNVYSDTGPLTVTSLDVRDEQDASVLHLDARGVADAVRPEATAGRAAQVRAGQRITVFVWLTLTGRSTPQRLRHRIDFVDSHRRPRTVDGVPVVVATGEPLRLGAPVQGGLWLAHEGPGNPHSHHWGSWVAVNGLLTIPQRFAIDLVGIDVHGRAFGRVADPHATTHADWLGYGTPVLAVGDGRVVAARDGQREHAPLEAQGEPPSLSLDGLFGNYVVIDLGTGQFAGYAHLKPGSVRVNVGERVAKGQVIGAVGQSGSSAAPHLHFQVANAATFEGSEGVPYVFSRLDTYGPEKEAQLFGTGAPWKAAPVQHGVAQMPLDDTVVSFPDMPLPHP